MTESYQYCRICGYDCGEPLWIDGKIPTYLICPCCGAEAGLNDETVELVQAYRQQWLTDKYMFAQPPTSFAWHGESGWMEQYEAYLAEMPHWFWAQEKPDHWNLEEQMQNIPEEFR